MLLFMSFSRFTWPSGGPWLRGSFKPGSTAVFMFYDVRLFGPYSENTW